jgi:hypothetical protein
MTNVDSSITKKQLTTLALLGLLILLLFAAGFVWLYDGVLWNGGGELFLAFAPFWIFPYLVVISVYVGFFCGKIRKRQMEACLALGNRWFCSDSPIHHGFSNLAITRISISRPCNIRGPSYIRILSTGTLGTVNRAVNIHPQKGNCVDGRTSH